MKLAVVGKGGSGKTTTAAVLARTFASNGLSTLALDCDTNPNLGISLGLGEEATAELVAVRDAANDEDGQHVESTDEMVHRFGVDAPGGVRLAVAFAIEKPNPGCPCCGISPEQLLSQLGDAYEAVVADFEAGLHTVLRMDHPVDVVVVVVEPTAKSLEVGARAVETVRERGLGRVVLMANKVRDDADLDLVRAAFPGLEPVRVPEDAAIIAAERLGYAPVDASPDAPAVLALVGLAESLQRAS